MKDNFEQQDERVLEERRKIQSRGYSLVVWGLLISLLIQVLMHAPFAQYAAEFWLLIGCSIYQIVANVRRGFSIWGGQTQNKRRLLLSTFISGIIAVVVISLISKGKDWTELTVFLVIYISVFYGLRQLLSYVSRKRQEELDHELDGEDEN